MPDITVTCTGPLFDGRAASALDRGTHAAQENIATEGERLVRSFFAGSIKDEHGKFLATVTTIERARVFVTVSGGKAYTMPIIEDRATDTIVTADLASYSVLAGRHWQHATRQPDSRVITDSGKPPKHWMGWPELTDESLAPYVGSAMERLPSERRYGLMAAGLGYAAVPESVAQ